MPSIIQKTLLLAIIGFGSMGYCAGQRPMNEDAYADSLSRLLVRTGNDSMRTRLCFELSDYWSYKDTTMSRHYLDRSRVLAKGNPYLEALYPFYEAGFYFDSDPTQ